MDVIRELQEIGDMMSEIVSSTDIEIAVKKEVEAIDKGAQISRGHSCYDVIVQCDDADKVARRIKSNLPDVRVDELVENILGVSRRGR